MGKQRIVAETGAGQHGVATATVCALLGLECVVYMGEEDVRRQAPNVFRMKLLGAEVRPVDAGSRTLKDAINEAIRDWVTNVRDTHYLIGSVVGPHPYPTMVRDFQSVIGIEARAQLLEPKGRLPRLRRRLRRWRLQRDRPLPPVLQRQRRATRRRRGGGRGPEQRPPRGAIIRRTSGRAPRRASYLLQDEDGQVMEAHSISAGLDYPGRRAGALLLQGQRARRVRRGHRPAGAGRLPAALARPRASSRRWSRRTPSPTWRKLANAPEGPDHPRQPVRPRRQGHGDRGVGA